MMLTLLAEAALRSFGLGAVVWTGLRMARVRNAQAELTAWTVVLISAIVMPALMQLPAVTLPAPAVPLVLTRQHIPAIALAIEPIRSAPVRASLNWRGLVGSCYLAGAIVMLLRLLTGLILTWRLRQGAVPVPAQWACVGDVRRSPAFAAPATFGSTILLPADSLEWDAGMREAVLAHERSHVEHGDFYIQLLASVYRAVFWFHPLAWYLLRRLAELAETRSDDAAIARFPDRPHYAELLLRFAKQLQRMPLAVAMARPASVVRRVDRILAGTPLSPGMNWRKTSLLIAGLMPLAVLAAGCSLHQRAKGPVQTAQIAAAPLPAPAVSASVPSAEPDGSASRSAKTDPRPVAVAERDFLDSGSQEELARQQEDLAKVQELLGTQLAQVVKQAPGVTAEMDALRMQIDMLLRQINDKVGKEFKTDNLDDLQSDVGDLMARLRDLHREIGDRQSGIGEVQSALEKRQAAISQLQSALAEEAAAELRRTIEEAVRKGLKR